MVYFMYVTGHANTALQLPLFLEHLGRSTDRIRLAELRKYIAKSTFRVTESPVTVLVEYNKNFSSQV